MPRIVRWINYLEIFNEVQVTLATYHLMIFTEWVHDKNQQYFMGWVFIIVINMCILGNLMFIVYHAWQEIKLFIIKWWRRFIEWLRLCCKKNPKIIERLPPPPEKTKFKIDSYQPHTNMCLVGGKVSKMVDNKEIEIDRVLVNIKNEIIDDDHWKHQKAPVEVERPKWGDIPAFANQTENPLYGQNDT